MQDLGLFIFFAPFPLKFSVQFPLSLYKAEEVYGTVGNFGKEDDDVIKRDGSTIFLTGK